MFFFSSKLLGIENSKSPHPCVTVDVDVCMKLWEGPLHRESEMSDIQMGKQ